MQFVNYVSFYIYFAYPSGDISLLIRIGWQWYRAVWIFPSVYKVANMLLTYRLLIFIWRKASTSIGRIEPKNALVSSPRCAEPIAARSFVETSGVVAWVTEAAVPITAARALISRKVRPHQDARLNRTASKIINKRSNCANICGGDRRTPPTCNGRPVFVQLAFPNARISA